MRPRYRRAGLSNLTPWSENAPRPGLISWPRPRWPSAWRWHPHRVRHRCRHPTPPPCCVATAPTPSSPPRPALRFGERIWTHAEMFAEATRYAACSSSASTRRGRRTWPSFSTTPPSTCSAWRVRAWPARRWWASTTRGATSTSWPTSATPTSSCSSPSRATRSCWRRWPASWPCPGGLLVSERFADGDDPARTMGEDLDVGPGPVGARHRATPGSSPTWRRCGCCCSPRGPRRRRRRCAAPSGACSPPATA